MENSLRGSHLPRPPKVGRAQPSPCEISTSREFLLLTRTKRTHSQMSGSGNNNHDLTYPAVDAGRSESRRLSVPPPPHTSGYALPGFDYRRPVTPSRAPSGPSNSHDIDDVAYVEIVDLTNSEDAESPSAPISPFGQARRGPRFARDIIDLSDEASSSLSSSIRSSTAATSNSDVQFVSERRLPILHRATVSSGPSSNVMDLTSDEPFSGGDSDDDVRFIRATHRYPHSSPAPPSFGVSRLLAVGGSGSSSNPLLRVANSISNSARQLAGLRSASNSSHQHHPPAAAHTHPPLPSNLAGLAGLAHNGPGAWGSSVTSFIAPMFDFDTVGFDLGLNDTPVPLPPPSIIPPKPAPAGYARSPKPDETYICPNCDRELRTGDTELQRQIWVIRACGHVYCGECANHRSASKQKKEKKPANTKPFNQCVEKGCGRKTVGKHSMIQIFL